MSAAREVKEDIDLTVMGEVAESLGYRIAHKAEARGYYGAMKDKQGQKYNADLVIKGNSGYDIGFLQDEVTGETTRVEDMHGGHAASILKKVIPTYYEEMILRRAKKFGFRTLKKEVTQNKTRVYVGRRT